MNKSKNSNRRTFRSSKFGNTEGGKGRRPGKRATGPPDFFQSQIVKRMKYTDDSLMPWGAHKGKPLSDVPDDYFLFLWEGSKQFAPGTTVRANNKPLFDYIAENIDAIRANIARQKK